MNEKEAKIENLNKWLEDFRTHSPYADVNLVGESEDYVRGFRDGIQDEGGENE